MMKAILPCLFLIGPVTVHALLTIGSFNIQRLSNRKMENATLVKEIAQILVRFDIASVEEVIHEPAFTLVLQEMNRIGGPYSLTLSSAMGRTSYVEHLAIVFRSDKVTLRDVVEYPDHNDDFEREPYSAFFHSTFSSITDFAIMGVHLKPHSVLGEMNSLLDAYNQASTHFGTENFVITGDFNADCRYLSNTRYHETDLWTDDRFHFLLDNDVDTTTTTSDCAYDRFIVTGAVMSAVVSDSVRVCNMETLLHISNDHALDISDHQPIEMQLH